MNKKQQLQKCRDILYSKNILPEDEQFLKELIMLHPHSNIKIGIGIKCFEIKYNPYGQLGFHIIRKDNSKTDFSFYECISPKNKNTRICLACRNTIKDLIKNTKKNKENIIHHEKIYFNKLVKDWIKENPLIDLSLNPPKDNCYEIYFINPLTINSFYEYHLKNANLLELTPKEHKLKHKKEVGEE